MSYLKQSESEKRVKKVRKLLDDKDLDALIVYYDEFNIGNGWYLTGWCPQFESGAVLIPRKGEPMILGGPESEPYAKLDSAIKNTRNFPVFMVPDEEYPNAEIIDFPQLFQELHSLVGSIQRIGMVGADRMPAAAYRQIREGFKDVERIDVTSEFVAFRFIKSEWEREKIRQAFKLADRAYYEMKAVIDEGISEIQVAAAGEYAVRQEGANGYGFRTIVGSGKRSNAVVPTASTKIMNDNELVMIGISPKVSGYAGVVGHTLPVSGKYTAEQKKCMDHLRKAFQLTKDQLFPGNIGEEIDAPARAYFESEDLSEYLVCPFAHTIGLHEAEAPFLGPNSKDVLKAGMMVSIDISFFGHPYFNGVRIETGYEITEEGPIPLSRKMDDLFCKN
jgi:Xaa-Pro aminopeptidase